MALLLGGVALAALVPLAVEVTGFGDREEPPTGVIATVDGVEVTEDEWEFHLFLASSGLAYQRDLLADPPEYLEAMPQMRAYFGEMLEIMEAYPAEVRAIGAIVGWHAVDAERKRRGLPPVDEAEVRARVDEQRGYIDDLLETAPDEEGAARYLDLIDHFGVDRYFGEILPMVLRRTMAWEPLREERARDPQTWEDYVRELTQRVHLVLGEELEAQFSAGDVWEYLERSAEVTQPGPTES
jgi:hypothetical protein